MIAVGASSRATGSAPTSASCCARSRTRARSRSRTPRPSTRSRSSTRRSKRAWTTARTSCTRRRRSSCTARRCARSASSWRASPTSSTTRSASCTRTCSCSRVRAELVAAHRAGEEDAHRDSDREAAVAQPRRHRARQADRADLRTFSRIDQAVLSEVDLNDEIDRTLTLMEPRLQGRRSRARLRRAAAGALLRRPAEPGLHEPADERMPTRSTARARSASRRAKHRGSPLDVKTACASSSRRRTRHVARSAVANLRAVLHDQARRAGHGPRPLDLVRHRRAPRRPMLVGSAPGEGATFMIRLPLGREAAGPREGDLP